MLATAPFQNTYTPSSWQDESTAVIGVISRLRDRFVESVMRSVQESVLDSKRYEALKQLIELTKLKDGWDSYGAPAPNATAIEKAYRILNFLEGSDFMTIRILPSAEGGVGICFLSGDHYADLECSNDGEVIGVRHIGKQVPTLVETDGSDTSIRNALEEIRNHIRG